MFSAAGCIDENTGMSNFNRVVTLTTITIALSIGLSRIIGHGQVSTPVQRLQMDRCASPCIMGITVGQTSYQGALTVLHKLRETRSDITAPKEENSHISFSMKPLEDVGAVPTPIVITFENAVVRSIRVGEWTYLDSMPTLADLTLAYGTPKCAIEDWAAGNHLENIYIVDRKRGLLVYIFGIYPLNWGTPVDDFSVLVTSPSEIREPCGCYSWHGPRSVNGLAGGMCGD